MVLPRFMQVASVTLGLSLVLVACGGSSPSQAGGGDGGPTPEPVGEHYTLNPAENPPFQLAAGNYKVGWKTTGCDSVTVRITGDNGYSFEKSSRTSNYSTIVMGMPDGVYTVEQVMTECVDWTVTIDKL